MPSVQEGLGLNPNTSKPGVVGKPVISAPEDGGGRMRNSSHPLLQQEWATGRKGEREKERREGEYCNVRRVNY